MGDDSNIESRIAVGFLFIGNNHMENVFIFEILHRCFFSYTNLFALRMVIIACMQMTEEKML
jgi:hypothetical protein